jgi:hypothetical protein
MRVHRGTVARTRSYKESACDPVHPVQPANTVKVKAFSWAGSAGHPVRPGPPLEVLRRALLRPTGPPVSPDELLRRGYVPRPSRWHRWLAWQAGFRRGPVGDLARSGDLPAAPRRAVRHLRRRAAPRWKLEAARTAVREFRIFEAMLR